jgi:hypothetical protein
MTMDVVLQTVRFPTQLPAFLAVVMVGNSEPHGNKIKSFHTCSFELLCHVFPDVSEFRSMYICTQLLYQRQRQGHLQLLNA